MKNFIQTISLALLFFAPTTGHALQYLKRFASFADKATAIGCFAYPFYASHAANNIAMKKAQPLSTDIAEPMQNMVTDLCERLDVNHRNIEIKQISIKDFDAAASNSLFGKNTVFVGEEFLKFPHDRQKAIMAHELIHIKHRDSIALVGATTALSVGALGSFRLGYHVLTKAATCAQKASAQHNFTSLSNAIDKIKGKALSPLRSFSAPFIAAYFPQLKGTSKSYHYDEHGKLDHIKVDDGGKYAGIGLKLRSQYQRFSEKRADIESAQLAGTAQGSIDYLQSETGDLHTATLDQHPCAQERIKYLKPLVPQGK